MAATRPKIALTWCSGCGGCEESVLDLAQDLPALLEEVEVVYWPVALDHKRERLLDLEDGELAAAFVNGAIRTQEDQAMARLLRAKARLLFAHGACAHLGGVPGLANLHPGSALLERSFRTVETVGDSKGPLPGQAAGTAWPPLTELCTRVRSLGQVVPVDYVIPGCPPPPELVGAALRRLLDHALPEPGASFGEPVPLCRSCPRRETLPERVRVKGLRRLHETRWDPKLCFLPQGLVCLGPATRGGCGARCLGANMPCRGCFGPPEGVTDPGAAVAALLASLLDPSDEAVVGEALAHLPDPAGLCYRYGLAASALAGLRPWGGGR